MLRLPNWSERLSALIAHRLHAPFEWGQHDCALWGADAWLAVTGQDRGAEYRGTYHSARGALKRLREVDGVKRPVEAFDKWCGPRRPPAMAKVGSIVAADLAKLGAAPNDTFGLGLSMGVCYGASSLFVGSDGDRNGLIFLPTRFMEHCYE